ncbi:hypothetical protein QEH56_01460 [Pelagicoccus enzymogenes]|uniref:hypothetical protein n=1 Tax=Pelagicoccus enzymogenes TaxID=2773457 RepID=UPI0028105A86|nr:hypothetical protein [Pelagicoccus enzymogenes]MDQ8196791.1 hypothetical protein [Pelagicoccus enzymogenes]
MKSFSERPTSIRPSALFNGSSQAVNFDGHIVEKIYEFLRFHGQHHRSGTPDVPPLRLHVGQLGGLSHEHGNRPGRAA